MRKESISPKVPRMANLKKLISKPCLVVVLKNQSHAPGMKAKPQIIAAITIIVVKSDFFIYVYFLIF